jgi:hypothetical protein
VHEDSANVVGVGGELGHALKRVEIENTNHQIVRAHNNPILPSHKPDSSNWKRQVFWKWALLKRGKKNRSAVKPKCVKFADGKHLIYQANHRLR